MTEYRFYADQESGITVYLEPWGSEYIIPKNSHLRVCVIGPSELVEIRSDNGYLQVYFNGPEIDEANTGVFDSL
jgi:hypothetical protein